MAVFISEIERLTPMETSLKFFTETYKPPYPTFIIAIFFVTSTIATHVDKALFFTIEKQLS